MERNPKIIILDEPTAALSPLETQGLFDVISRLRDEGRAVIFITHKLKEVMAISDRISVLRRGRIVGGMPRAQADETKIASLMVGSEVAAASLAAANAPPQPAAATQAPVLEIRGLAVRSDNGTLGVEDLTLTARAGEIIGIAGVEGNGQIEFAEALYGIRPAARGTIVLEGSDISAWSSLRRRSAGLRYIPLDRQREGLVLEFDGVENAVLGDQRRMQRAFAIDFAAAARRADSVATEYRVRGYSRSQPMRRYSGGTQQKFLIGRELDAQARVVIACTPTRGVDIGAAEIIYQRLRAIRASGACVLLISYDLDEVRALSDRILVFFRGRIVGERRSNEADDTTLGRLMGGIASQP
ncbi:MAG TPA: ATP-binding cassette domain-containing protein [Candidatus Eremiobacteraceae bacterium]|nr:ATP-binding cassette domain-containing protein [Candidatus Eremiobacteraceae bacterium]